MKKHLLLLLLFYILFLSLEAKPRTASQRQRFRKFQYSFISSIYSHPEKLENLSLTGNFRKPAGALPKMTSTYGPNGRGFTSLLVGNFGLADSKEIITITVDPNEQEDSFSKGEIFIDLGEKLFQKWLEGGEKSGGLVVVDSTMVKLISPEAFIGIISLAAKEVHSIDFYFKTHDRSNVTTKCYITAEQLDLKSQKIVAKERFVLKPFTKDDFHNLNTITSSEILKQE